ncbi:MAG: DUF1993 domain-containing protein [Sphingobium sp.]
MTLYDAFVPSCLQILHAVLGLLDKAKDHADAQQLPIEQLIHTRLAPDMYDFAYQVKSCAVHSIGAIRGIQNGNFSPDMTPPPEGLDDLKAKIEGAIQALEALSAADLEALGEKPMTFTIGDKLLVNFVGKDFLLSFAQPNFYFHASMVYAILRMSGVGVGKRDYLGDLRKLP